MQPTERTTVLDLNNKIRIAGIVEDSIVDGPGLRISIFVQGCPHACEGCHNPQTWDFDGGHDMTIGAILERIKHDPLLDGVTFSGGEPMCKAKALAFLAKKSHEMGLNVIVYTGYIFEYLLEHADDENGYMELLKETDILIDGPFVLKKRDLELKFKGSSNQRIIDVKRSLEEGKTVICEL
ncbi:MAG: anaerobic ribonucleoside-triphosphate reductase activating protein [Oscillospiraceae bacterium]|nr:anaerobic ribonucleoside-triphosphate reductase activating protein [Oscillospiraceae bacterium]